MWPGDRTKRAVDVRGEYDLVSVMDSAPVVERLAAPFVAQLLRHDLPGLPQARLDDTVKFIRRRLSGLPSFVRFGVTVIGGVVRAISLGPAEQPVLRFLATRPLPLFGEYVRLTRSLGYAYVWETWPDTLADGTPK